MDRGKMDGGFLSKNAKKADFAKGGDTHMFPQQAAEPSPAGLTRDPTRTDSVGQKFAKGGSNKMFGYAGVMTAEGGKTSAR